MRSPRPRITTGALGRNRAQSEPSDAATSVSRVPASAPPDSRFSARRAATALLLPPPSPAPRGIRLVSLKPAPPRQPVAAANACAGSVHRHHGIVARERESRGRFDRGQLVPEIQWRRDRHQIMESVGPLPGDSEKEIELSG
jgi:hypothetical protein